MYNFVSLFENIHNKYMEKFYNVNNQKKEKNISNNENYYLNIIFKLKKLTLSKFAELAKITKPAATQIINKYIVKGYVVKKKSDKDRRVYYIELTEQIKKYFVDSYNRLNRLYKDSLSFLSEEEIQQFNNILLKINDNLNKKTNPS